MWQQMIHARSVNHALAELDKLGKTAKIAAGATDLTLEFRNGAREGVSTIIDISRIPGLGKIWKDEQGFIHLDAMVTHNDCVASALIQQEAIPLAQACWSIGSPQIRNRGTVIGNLVTASPANDTITPLIALRAVLRIQSVHGEKFVALQDFYKGVRQTVLIPDEMVTEVTFKGLSENWSGVFVKHALRNAQAISLVNCAVLLERDNDIIKDCVVTLGAVAPTIMRAVQTEELLRSNQLTQVIIDRVGDEVSQEVKPISDIRCSAAYRKAISGVLVKRALQMIRDETIPPLPQNPVLLWGQKMDPLHSCSLPEVNDNGNDIELTVNGKKHSVANWAGKTVLQMLRDELHLMGTKEGCAEGECGSCTIFMDGAAVLACLVPAGRAAGATITTIEGMSDGELLNPVQKAFVEGGAVQCGFCTPGFVMSASKLLEEKPAPGIDEIKTAISGNLCRCTGYYQIIKAIEKAAKEGQ